MEEGSDILRTLQAQLTVAETQQQTESALQKLTKMNSTRLSARIAQQTNKRM